MGVDDPGGAGECQLQSNRCDDHAGGCEEAEQKAGLERLHPGLPHAQQRQHNEQEGEAIPENAPRRQEGDDTPLARRRGDDELRAGAVERRPGLEAGGQLLFHGYWTSR
jgi:hypothetical protein